MTVLVLVEHAGGQVDELSLQALALARGLADGEAVETLLVGEGAAGGGRRARPATAWPRRTWPRTSGSPPTRPPRGRRASRS